MFKDPLKPTKKQNGYKEWSFAAPSKDELSSGCITAGNDYGVGRGANIGREGNPSVANNPIPKKAEKFSADKTIEASQRG